MSGRFFLDTNIFLYSFDANSPSKPAQCTKLIRRAIETREGEFQLSGGPGIL